MFDVFLQRTVGKHDPSLMNRVKMGGTSAFMLVTLILVSNNCRVTESFGIDVIGNIQTAANFFNDAYGVVNGDLPISSLLTGSTGVMLDNILESVGGISDKIDDLSVSFTAELRASDIRNAKRFSQVHAAINQVMTELPRKGKLNEDMREFRSYVTRVNSLYKEFEYYSRNKTNFNQQSINYFMDAAVSRNRGDLFDILQQMYTLIIQEDWYYTEGIMQLYAHNIRTTDTEKLCGVGLSPQTRYYKMYETIFMTEARAFIMQLFAFSVKSAYSRISYVGELNLAKSLMLERIEKYFLAAMNQMQGLQKVVELCDAPNYKNNIDYVILQDTVSLLPKKANVGENMVVSGVRFVKRPDGMIDYQIKEAKILPQGQVALGTWKELPQMDKYETPDVDFAIVETIEDFFFTDDLQLDPGYVVVGVDFQQYDARHERIEIGLSICGMKFDANTGQLVPGSEKWTTRVASAELVPSDLSREVRNTSWPGNQNPTKADRNFIDSELYERCSLNVTDDGEVVPFFDARPVEMSLPNFALTGMGMYHRGAPGYGGFLNFRFFNIDLAEYMQQHDIMETATDNP